MPRRRKDSDDMLSFSSNEDVSDDLQEPETMEEDHFFQSSSNNNNNNNKSKNINNNRLSKHHHRKSHNNHNNNNNNNGSKLYKPIQRNAANARERSRMRVLSKAFSKLKTTLPWVPPDTKLSKLDTLRLASSYIAHLRQILDVESQASDVGGSPRAGPYIHPLNLTWPFTFNGRTAALNEGKSPEPVKCPTKSQGSIQC